MISEYQVRNNIDLDTSSVALVTKHSINITTFLNILVQPDEGGYVNAKHSFCLS